MGLTGKLESELEIESPADKYFHAWVDHANLFPKAVPHDSHKAEVHEGDGKSVGSVNSFNYVLEGDAVSTCKAKIEAIDEENKSITFNAYDGDMEKFFKKFKAHVQIVPKGDKSSVKWFLEYEKINEEVPDPTNYMDFAAKFCKGLDAHLLKG